MESGKVWRTHKGLGHFLALAVEVLDRDGNPAWRIVLPAAPFAVGLAFASVAVLAFVGSPVESLTSEALPVEAVAAAKPTAPATEVALEAVPSVPPPNGRRIEASLRSGENLSLLFQRERLSATDLDGIVKSGPIAKRLRSIKPGEEITIDVNDDNDVTRLAWQVDVWETVEFARVGDGYRGREVTRSPIPKRGIYTAAIANGSLFVAATRAGLEDEVAMRLADVFRWDVDFITQVRPGDAFRVLIEEHWLEGEFQEFGPILAAEFTNRGRSHVAVRYENSSDGATFFNPDGRPLRKSFLKAPLKFTRVSSHFNPSRVHPLWGTRRPHRGTDYAAPTGTPVLATGAGRVTRTGHTAPNGNYVVIRHSGGIETKYLHLSRIEEGIKRGTSVKQGDMIGRVGSTGWSTGPHLHYEFVVDGVHRDPVTVELPKSEPIPEADKLEFLRATAPLLADLRAPNETNPQLASAFGED